MSADGGELIVETSGISDLDGANGDGVLNAQKGKLKVLGFNSLAEFDGTLNVGRPGVPQEFEMPSGGLDSTGAINLAGGVYRGKLRQDGDLVVSFNSTIVSAEGVFGVNGLNVIGADLQLDGAFRIEQGAAFSGSGSLVVIGGSKLQAEDGAEVAVRLDNFGVVAPGEGATGEAGILDVAYYTQRNDGRLMIDLLSGGGVPGVDHDLLDVGSGATLLGGTLEARFADGFKPRAGDEFLVMRSLEGVSGAFDHLVHAPLSDVKLAVRYDEFSVRLVAVAVPEPRSGALVLLAALVGVARGRGLTSPALRFMGGRAGGVSSLCLGLRL